jgi:1-acyl-sn-glycerol-3-phosphate acyltransferase
MNRIRCLLFNFLFYIVWTPLICLGGLPSLVLPRRYPMAVSRFYMDGVYWLEKHILGLDYEVRGIENKPKDGTPYLAGAKHYSAYETTKLLRLFGDPTIILKKELLWLPVFGWYLQRLEVIALNRTDRNQSRSSLYEGAKKMRENGRPIAIFPQGTRVGLDTTTKERPYKGGIVKLYTELNLPILPVALNSGLYWPRNSFWKKPGKVIIEFLPLIPPGLPASEALQKLEEAVETASNRLVEEGRKSLQRA